MSVLCVHFQVKHSSIMSVVLPFLGHSTILSLLFAFSLTTSGGYLYVIIWMMAYL